MSNKQIYCCECKKEITAIESTHQARIEECQSYIMQLEQEITRLRGDQYDRLILYGQISHNKALKAQNDFIKRLEEGSGSLALKLPS